MATSKASITYARGFTIKETEQGIKVIEVSSPWPDAKSGFSYALVPKNTPEISLDKEKYDAVVRVPVERIVVTSTTHIPALESLGVADRLVGFPNSQFVSSKETRKRIASGQVKELGTNEAINTEILMELSPELMVGFGISGKNKAYETLQQAGIPLVYNGDWTEETPLGKAEWIKFFAPFFGLEKKGDSLYKAIELSYARAKELALQAKTKPTILSGGLYKDVWYVAGGKSWMAEFLRDANTNYLWKETENTGSIGLSIESVLERAQDADFWLNPSMHTSYNELEETNRHYLQFSAFKNKRVFTHARSIGETGGLLFYEYAPNRPDVVLKDLIHIFHPELLPDHELFFFKPLE
ncbi:ABC transporter substrate-binding protein [Flavobacteriaceae bacterium R33]|uniref:ABC transporter substrate-binding protein n=2 Tax=Poritiphilus flavus TaxID=2697053 RepID=A0A6L9EA97_9FLAO|nr:ABC transporter substrate-binding protein [Poritiphilus flavus]